MARMVGIALEARMLDHLDDFNQHSSSSELSLVEEDV